MKREDLTVVLHGARFSRLGGLENAEKDCQRESLPEAFFVCCLAFAWPGLLTADCRFFRSSFSILRT